MSPHDYVPKVGDMATITLPGEITRGSIERVISETKIIVRLATYTTAKDHNYRRGDHVPCRLLRNGFGHLEWQAIPERELREATEREEKRAAEPVPLAISKQPEDGFVLGEN